MSEARSGPGASGTPAEVLKRYLSGAAQRDLDALRSAVDTRLAALEAALDDAGNQQPLETLVFDLARTVAAEAESATTRTALAAQLDAEERIAAGLANAQREAAAARDAAESFQHELEQARAALASDRQSAVGLRRELEAARASLERELKSGASLRAEIESVRASIASEQQKSASLKAELENARAALERARGDSSKAQAAIADARRDLDSERQAAAALGRELAKSRSESVAERETAAALRRDLEAVQAAFEDRRNAAAALTRQVEEARERLTADRAANDALRRDFDESQRLLATERETAAQLRQELEDVRAAADADHRDAVERLTRERDRDLQEQRTALEAQRETVGSLSRQLDSAQHALEAERVNAANTASQLEEQRAARTQAVEALAGLERQLAVTQKVAAARERVVEATRTALTRLEQRADELERALREANARARVAGRDRDGQTAAESGQGAATASPTGERQPAGSTAPRASGGTRAENVREPDASDVELSPLLDVKPPSGEQPLRRTARYTFTRPMEARVGSTVAVLVDLSLSGAQVLSTTPIEEDQVVDIALVSDEIPISCKGRIMWMRVERTSRKQPVKYRAGVLFSGADEAALEAFIIRYATPPRKKP